MREAEEVRETQEMIVNDDDEQHVKDALDACRIQAETIAMQRYSDVEKTKFTKVIKEFNALYHRLNVQTWCNTKWRGVPLCKAPTDLWIYQELIHGLKPDLIIETGTLAGGSALFMRDVMKLDDNHGWVISIDTNMGSLNKVAEMAGGIRFLLASSTSFDAVAFVKAHIASYEAKRVMVILDSSHEKDHVLKELELYAPLVTKGSALIVEDTGNHDGAREAADDWYCNQPDNYEFRKDYMCEKFMLTFNRDGYFERIK